MTAFADPNPRPRLFEFCTGDEIDVDRYVSMSLRGATAHFQMRSDGYIRVEFGSREEMQSELERMRRFRDPGRGAVASAREMLETASADEVQRYIETGERPDIPRDRSADDAPSIAIEQLRRMADGMGVPLDLVVEETRRRGVTVIE